MLKREGSRAEVAELLNLSERRISQLVNGGRLSDGTKFPSRMVRGRRTFDLAACRAWYIRFKVEEVRHRATQHPVGMVAIRRRKVIAQAELVEHKVHELSRTLIAKEDAAAEIIRFRDRVSLQILTIADRYPADLLNLRSLPEAGAALDRLAAAILTDLQRDAGGAHDLSDLLALEGAPR